MKYVFLSLIAIVTLSFASQPSYALTDAEIKQAIIQESQVGYPGNCPCPYNRDRAGRSCGKRSAYNRAGGYSPLCFPSDVTAEMVQTYRQSHEE